MKVKGRLLGNWIGKEKEKGIGSRKSMRGNRVIIRICHVETPYYELIKRLLEYSNEIMNTKYPMYILLQVFNNVLISTFHSFTKYLMKTKSGYYHDQAKQTGK
jgi:hypothetical protein